MPKEDTATHGRVMIVLQALMLGMLVALFIPAFQIYGEIKPEFRSDALQQLFPANWPYILRFAALIVPMTLIAGVMLAWIAREMPGGLAGLWRAHRPILTVFGVGAGIILLGLFSGPWSFNFVVLMHFVGWYIFGRYMLSKHPPKDPPRGWWQWMRTTTQGFTVLHLGLTVVAIALVAISSYVFGKADTLEHIVGSKAFFYWTIVHVTLSFFPR